MGFQLRVGVSYCEVSERLLFLDTVADRYFCLQAEVEHAFRSLIAEKSTDYAGRQKLASLIDTGLLIETADAGVPFPFRPVQQASLSLLDTPDQSVSGARVASALAYILTARYRLRRSRLDSILKNLDLKKIPWPRNNIVDLDEMRTVAIAFERTSLFLQSHGKCLSRSIALARFLAAHGLPAQLVIAVKLRPFAAHCWVQSGRWLLNDRIDTVRNFTPILAI